MSETNEAVTVHRLRTKHQTNPLGIDETTLVLSWQLDSTRRGVLQSAYQVLVARSEADLRLPRVPDVPGLRRHQPPR